MTPEVQGDTMPHCAHATDGGVGPVRGMSMFTADLSRAPSVPVQVDVIKDYGMDDPPCTRIPPHIATTIAFDVS
jgi:hypothetical protein